MTFLNENTKESLLKKLINQINEESVNNLSIIPFACPIISFGDYKKSIVATMGLNPSDREFLDVSGKELDGNHRRFHTLNSLDLRNWAKASTQDLSYIEKSCENYFSNKPYYPWFRDMQNIILATGFSFYKNNACHLDLIPYATRIKWANLSKHNKNSLLDLSRTSLLDTLVNSKIKLIVLNGKSVVDGFERLTNIKFKTEVMIDWRLPQKNNKYVERYSYMSKINNSNFPNLNRDILILGFNHNLQSSFGVSSQVKNSIKQWVARSFKGD